MLLISISLTCTHILRMCILYLAYCVCACVFGSYRHSMPSLLLIAKDSKTSQCQGISHINPRTALNCKYLLLLYTGTHTTRVRFINLRCLSQDIPFVLVVYLAMYVAQVSVHVKSTLFAIAKSPRFRAPRKCCVSRQRTAAVANPDGRKAGLGDSDGSSDLPCAFRACAHCTNLFCFLLTTFGCKGKSKATEHQELATCVLFSTWVSVTCPNISKDQSEPMAPMVLCNAWPNETNRVAENHCWPLNLP